MEKLGRDITKNEPTPKNSVATAPNNTVEFTITIRVLTPSYFNNIKLTDRLPAQFTYVAGSTKVDGQSVADGIVTTSGILIPTVTPGKPLVVTFLTKVAPETNFQIGTTNMVNVAKIEYSTGSKESQLPITVQRSQVLGTSTIGKVAGIKTGFSTNLVAFIAALIGANAYLIYIQTPYGRKRSILGLMKKQGKDADFI